MLFYGDFGSFTSKSPSRIHTFDSRVSGHKATQYHGKVLMEIPENSCQFSTNTPIHFTLFKQIYMFYQQYSEKFTLSNSLSIPTENHHVVISTVLDSS